ncbi:MAG: aerotolerance regulator BatA [Bacteroidetes bacterium QS_7_67_15]|nr:MAG: aerotolerance regulator BatA [Bacteroidetes bacterium QS_7_67_15]
MSFNFATPELLWLLLLVPLLGWWEWRKSRHKPTGLRFGSLLAVREAPQTVRTRLRWLPPALRMGALALGVLALARPQQLDATRERSTEGIDIMLVLDTSTSMRAEDFQPNRFVVAKQVAAEFVRSRTSDRVGLVVFAAKAYTQTPLTLDYSFFLRMLEEVHIGMIEDGTAIGTAVAMATARLEESQAGSKVAIVLTDGQNNRGEVDPVTAAEVAETVGVRVYTIGVGRKEDSGSQNRSPFFGPPSGAAIDAEMLTKVAQQTGGRYFRAESKEALRTIYDEISQLEKTEIDERVYTDRTERYGWFLWPALGLVLLEVTLTSTTLRRFP